MGGACGMYEGGEIHFLNSVSSDFPHILCLTEHHIRSDELDSIGLNQYNLGAKFCR
jgi:hypothetical protein